MNSSRSTWSFAKCFFAAGIVFLFCISEVSAQTYWVAPYGSNHNDRQQAQNPSTPWQSIQVALNRAPSGSTICVKDGTYWGHFDFRRSNVTLKSENREGALIVGSIFAQDLSYLKVEGFEVTNRRADAPRSKGVSFVRSHHITVRDCRVRNCRGGGIGFDQSDSILCEWNVVHHNAFFDVAQHSGISVYQPQRRGPDDTGSFSIKIRNNTCFGNQNFFDNPLFGRPTDGNGIVLDDGLNYTAPTGNGVNYTGRILVENNLCYLNGGQGVHCYQTTDVYIRNNTLYKNMKSFDFGGEVSVVRGDRVNVYNNILVARDGRNAALQFESGHVWFNYNLLDGPSEGVFNRSSTVYGPAGFDPDGFFKLHPSSRAIDGGLTNYNVFSLDVDGMPRIVGHGVDIGAKEFAF